GMGRHVPAIGEQRHRAEQDAGDDLADHHDRGEDDHEPGAALVAGVFGAEKDVVVGPLVEGMGMHGPASARDATRFVSTRYNAWNSEYYHIRNLRRMGGANGSRERAPDDGLREIHHVSTTRSDGFRFALPSYGKGL